ncbi:MAG: S9 family peptidase [Rhizobiales bacterium]|nr:S9 family peptidase [Hyphomicrobiales bacterium]
MDKRIKPYGTWASPISADLVAGKSLRLGQVQGVGGDLYWTEGRPSDGGRITIVHRDAEGGVVDLLPPPYSARSSVHEYGGGELLATASGIYFVNADDQDVYRVEADGKIARLTETKGWRFSDLFLDQAYNRLIGVAEIHKEDHDPAPANALAAISLQQGQLGTVQLLSEGQDFYASPRLSPDGQTLAWLEWSLPHMPWEDATLKTAVPDAEGLNDIRTIAGGDGTAAFQPAWSADGTLFFVWDQSGWGNLHRLGEDGPECICERGAEFGLPLWALGAKSYAVLPDGRLFVTYFEEGRSKAALLTPEAGALAPLETGLSNVFGPTVLAGKIAAQITSDTEAPAIGLIDLDGSVSIVRRSAEFDLAPEAFSAGQVLKLQGKEGRTTWALYYPPASVDHIGPEGDAPPILVSAHGGPTGMADRGLKLKVQYWTSRGFAYLDVDYAGSWGYGRAYREALNGQWGVADVEDVIAASEAVVAKGLADPGKLMISGGSAGGYTVLSALAFHDLYAAGASYYGVADLEKLLALTHKFESGYLYALTGTQPGNTEAVFKERSPLEHADQISSPVIFFQGDKDFVVPPGQSRDMATSLENRGVPVAYFEFAGEGHGFRAAATIAQSLQAEYAFYARVLNLTPEEKLVEIKIKNEGALT